MQLRRRHGEVDGLGQQMPAADVRDERAVCAVPAADPGTAGGGGTLPGMNVDAELRRQLAYLERSSTFYRERLGGLRERVGGVADLPLLPFTTKDELRAAQASQPPLGAHLCAPPEALVRIHVTSGTTGEPVAIGLTRADHEANKNAALFRGCAPRSAPLDRTANPPHAPRLDRGDGREPDPLVVHERSPFIDSTTP